jgi:translation initiation factor IF-3
LAIKRKRSRRSSGRTFELPRREQPSTRTNHAIAAPSVRLVDEDGTQLGIRPIEQARAYAQDKGLDLVEVAPAAEPPVCRVMDYSKFRYEQERKAKQSKRNSTQVSIKEIRVRPKIGAHDYGWKKARLVEFLEDGCKVKLVVLFRGREREHPERGRGLLERFAADISDSGVVETTPTLEGRSMTMVVGPKASS